MEALRQDDPRRFGPYTTLARFRETASAVRYLARGADGDGHVVVTAARPELAAVPAFRRRFQAEARAAERLSGGWVQSPLAGREDEGPEGDGLWTAAAYVPALTLAEAISLTGPLPERAVRVLGAGLAETLSRVHAAGTVLQGLAPGTVLLAEDGPRLTAFGPLGGAASAEARPGGQLSVRLGYLTPEQVEGGEAGAPSDLFVLGLLLAYAATGTTPFAEGPAGEAAGRIAHGTAELDRVPDALRELVARCLAKDPADRPGAGSVAAELALEGAAGLAGGGWLPERVTAVIADQAARVRALKDPSDPEADTGADAGAGADAAAAGTGVAGASPEADPVATDPAATGPAGAERLDATPDRPAPADAPPAGQVPGGPGRPADDEDRGTTRFTRTGPGAPHGDRSTSRPAVPPGFSGPAPVAPRAPFVPPPSGPPLGQVPASHLPYPSAGPAAPASPPLPHPAALPLPAPAASVTGRRNLLTAVAAGAAGLVVGGGSVLALGSDAPATPTDGKPTAKPRPTVPGRAPDPLWMYTHPAEEPAPLTAGIWRDRLLVLTSDAQATGIDLRTGRTLWTCEDAAGAQAVRAAGDGLCLLAGPTEFLWLSPEDGRVEHRLRYADRFTGVPGMKAGPLTGLTGSVLWFTGSHTVTVKAPEPKKGKKRGKDTQVVKAYFFAYDVVRRKELWRSAVPAGRAPGTPAYRLTAVRESDLVVAQTPATLTPADVKAGKGKASFRCFDRTTGKLLWNRPFGAVAPAGAAVGDDEGLLYAAVGDGLQAFETGTGKPVWTLSGSGASVYGTPVPAGKLLHTTNRDQQVGAVEAATGRTVWRRSTEVPLGGNAPALTLSGGGKTLFAADASQVTAFSSADGRRLWKFQDIGPQDPEGAAGGSPYRVLAAGKTAVVQRERAFYAFPAR
ncbi:PQQ-binding-like beta-propeller repeat protein [Streptomyces sp. NBC_01754]|uniref:outer membrane protein assembly factor BamB family protein n=1 Tax=Streptomyces sp. NBC_01754 TaxID=2975930 RepID=UPI002DD9D8BB|nr:PQQ-binding-like beta-propeller repeat protein [Streptomyces sp. NBC_01754]WSC94802.1 PQQ-binding-like beta-propeller repeat protein [Streptomyces sp. NBC_01754]